MSKQTLFYVMNCNNCLVSTDLFLNQEAAKKHYDQLATNPDADVSYGKVQISINIDVNLLLSDKYCDENLELAQKYLSAIAGQCIDFGETIAATFTSTREYQ